VAIGLETETEAFFQTARLREIDETVDLGKIRHVVSGLDSFVIRGPWLMHEGWSAREAGNRLRRVIESDRLAPPNVEEFPVTT